MSDEIQPIGNGLDRFLKALGMPEVFDVANLADDWAEAAGEPFGSLSHPTSFGGGELVVTVADGSAASLLKFRIGDLVERLASRYGAGTITTVRIRVGNPKKAR